MCDKCTFGVEFWRQVSKDRRDPWGCYFDVLLNYKYGVPKNKDDVKKHPITPPEEYMMKRARPYILAYQLATNKRVQERAVEDFLVKVPEIMADAYAEGVKDTELLLELLLEEKNRRKNQSF